MIGGCEFQGSARSTIDPADYPDLVDALTKIIISAADAIRLQGKGGVTIKVDGSPVTAADEAAEAVIRDGLGTFPVLPIISEEEAERERPDITGGNYFLVDPLDGTKEFISGRDEYTINIALMADKAPILGVIAAPARKLDLARYRRATRRRAPQIFGATGRNTSSDQNPTAAGG